jgi:regulator of replication initiation timing
MLTMSCLSQVFKISSEAIETLEKELEVVQGKMKELQLENKLLRRQLQEFQQSAMKDLAEKREKALLHHHRTWNESQRPDECDCASGIHSVD